MKNKEKFSIIVASPSDYDQLVAEIYCDGRFVALISHEQQKGSFDIEMPGANMVESEILRKVGVGGFLQAIEEACQQLL